MMCNIGLILEQLMTVDEQQHKKPYKKL